MFSVIRFRECGVIFDAQDVRTCQSTSSYERFRSLSAVGKVTFSGRVASLLLDVSPHQSTLYSSTCAARSFSPHQIKVAGLSYCGRNIAVLVDRVPAGTYQAHLLVVTGG